MRFSTLIPVAFGVLAGVPFAAGTEAPQASPDPEIQGIVSEISAERIQRSVYVLASFKTRHTLSDPLPSGDGIGGACAWVRAEFERASAASGGRLQVELDSFVQKPVPRASRIRSRSSTWSRRCRGRGPSRRAASMS